MIPLVIIVVLAIYTWRTAKSTGRRPWLWLLVVLGVGITVQWIMPFIVGLVIAVVMLARGSTQQQMVQDISSWATGISLVFTVLTLVSMGYIAKRAGIVPDEPAFDAPPPPPTFGDTH